MRYMKNLILVALLFCTAAAIAQNQDYVVTLKNDTIHGKVVISKYSDQIQQVTVKGEQKKSTFKVYQVKSISNRHGIYHTLRIRGQYQLALLIKEGYLSYYKYSGNPTSTSLIFETPLLYKKTTEAIEVPNIGFKKQMKVFLSDCEATLQKFEADEYSRNDLEKVVDEYNQCIAIRTEQINEQRIVAVKESSMADEIDEISDAVSISSSIKDKVELLEMLADVQKKLKNGESIPSYLIGALKNKLTEEPELSSKLFKIIE